MIAIIGQVGSLWKPPKNRRCNEHPDRLAVWDVLTEPSIFGSEYTPYCRECYNERVEAWEIDKVGWCEHCEKHRAISGYTMPDGEAIHLCNECEGYQIEEELYTEKLQLEQEAHDEQYGDK